MRYAISDALKHLPPKARLVTRRLVTGPQGLALLSGMMLVAYWIDGPRAMLVAGLAVPAVVALLTWGTGRPRRRVTDGRTGLPLRAAALADFAAILVEAPRNGRATACFALEIDEFPDLRRANGRRATDEILQRIAERLTTATREGDVVALLGEGRFAVMPAALRAADVETAIQIAARLQAAVAEPISVNAARVYVTVSIGFVTPGQLPDSGAVGLMEAAEAALASARRHGNGAIRAWATGDKRGRIMPEKLMGDVQRALDSGEIHAWFQPQVSTDDGSVTGFEALVRWLHPDHGILSPAEFLPAVAAAGRMDRLGEVMLTQSLTALRGWERQGIVVPSVSINLNEDDLADPRLAERIRWELDRFDLGAERLCVEILETVLTPSEDDVMTRNVMLLSEMGVGIDLDDFGTGTASIAAIRRFDVHRIKIDRSFVTRIDQDRGQQDMVAAILSMADRLGLQTLAEGVETEGEHSMLAQLGCGTVQGYGIGAPMPFPRTIPWIEAHSTRIAEAQRLGRRVG